MWEVQPSNQWEKDVKRYAKKHPRELAAILNNLERYLSQLEVAPNARAASIQGFLHPEPGGVVAVDQKGSGANNLQETRAYTYADEAQKVLHLITIGNKDMQANDILISRRFVQDLTS
jgi:hypothetical protein